jgi:hypothetical protein
MAEEAPENGDHAPRWWRLLLGGSSRVASQRLTATIENFEADLRVRFDEQPGLEKSAWAKSIRAQLDVVREHHCRGEVDAAWRCFAWVERRELDKASPAELEALATALRREAKSKKLSSEWRANTIEDLLETAHIEEKLPADPEADAKWRLRHAARIRDEDSDNRYYKVALVRSQRSLLLLVLLAAIVLVLGLAAAVDWEADVRDPSVGFVALVALFGALGACLSAIRSLGRVGEDGRIPEHVASSAITITRPALGAAAALGVYAIAAGGLLNLDLTDEEAHLTVLALAFAAGFSERFVLSAVGLATGATERKDKA